MDATIILLWNETALLFSGTIIIPCGPETAVNSATRDADEVVVFVARLPCAILRTIASLLPRRGEYFSFSL